MRRAIWLIVIGIATLTTVAKADAVAATYGIPELAGAPMTVTGLSDQDAKSEFSLKTLTPQNKTAVICDDKNAIILSKGSLTQGGTPEAAGTCGKLFWLQDGRNLSSFTATFARTSKGPDLNIALSPSHVEVLDPSSKLTQDKTFAVIADAKTYAEGDVLYAYTSDHGWSKVSKISTNAGVTTIVAGQKYTYKLQSITLAKRKQDNTYLVDAATITSAHLPVEKTAQSQDANTPKSTTPTLDAAFEKCTPPDRFQDSFVVCMSVDAHGAIELTSLPEGHVVRPNRPILVMVRHPNTVGVTVTLNGTRGIFAPGIDDRTLAQGQEEVGHPAVVSTEVVVHSFAPRLPGNLDLKISTKPLDTTDTSITAQDDTEELIVDSTYGGAFRIGFGIVLGDAVDRSYAAVKAPGSSQSEIVATNSGSADLELVVGFSPFIEYLWGGRSYLNTWNLKHPLFGFAPYVGVGVLAFNGKTVDGFKSLYLGVEWEPVPFFSVAVAWIGRRVTRLSEGAVLGGPTSDGSVPTSDAFASGFGVVINVSPDFLRVAAKQNGTLFK